MPDVRIPTLAELRERHSDPAALEEAAYAASEQHQAAMRAVHAEIGNREPTASQQRAWDAHDEHDRELRAYISEQRTERVRASRARYGDVQVGGHGPAGPVGPGGALRSQALRLTETEVRAGRLPDHAADKVSALVERSGSEAERSVAARWVVAAGDLAYRSAFAKLAGDPVRGHLLWDQAEQAAYQRVAAVQAELRSMSVGTGSAGGFMVPLTLDPTIMLSSDGSINPLRQIARVVQTVTDSWKGVSSAGATAEWKAEAAQAADGSPTLGEPEIPVHFGDVYVPYSFEVGMDAENFLSELQRVMADAAANLQADAYTTGTGTGQPTGLITALTGTASELDTAGVGAFASADVYSVQNDLPPRFSGRARWGANIAILNRAAQFETTNGARLFPEISGNPPMLLRKPVHEVSDMSAATTTGQKILVYGDFEAGFVIADRIGTTIEFIQNVMGANQRPTGQRGAFLWFRTGSDVVVPEAFRLLNVQ